MEHGPELTVILPAFNEEAVLERMVGQLRSALAGRVEGLELLVVDDASTDGTDRVCQGLGMAGDLRTLRLPFRHGKEASLKLGLAQARGRLVAVMDADLQHPPEVLVAMLERLRQGDVKVVHGLKREAPMPGALERLAQSFRRTQKVDGRPVYCDFKLLGPEAVAGLRAGTRRLFFRNAVEELHLPSATVSFPVPARPAGVTKWNGLRLLAYAAGLRADASAAPLAYAGALGLLLALPPSLGIALLVGSLPMLPWWLGPLLLAVFCSDGVTLGVVGMKVYRQRLARVVTPSAAPSSGPGPSAGGTPRSR
jgi:dolichol-phosphate mannosyltransferase